MISISMNGPSGQRVIYLHNYGRAGESILHMHLRRQQKTACGLYT